MELVDSIAERIQLLGGSEAKMEVEIPVLNNATGRSLYESQQATSQ